MLKLGHGEEKESVEKLELTRAWRGRGECREVRVDLPNWFSVS